MTTREKMLKQGKVEEVLIVDFLTEHEFKLKQLHKQYIKESGDTKMSCMEFNLYIYHHAQDLVLNPSDN